MWCQQLVLTTNSSLVYFLVAAAPTAARNDPQATLQHTRHTLHSLLLNPLQAWADLNLCSTPAANSLASPELPPGFLLPIAVGVIRPVRSELHSTGGKACTPCVCWTSR